MGQSQSHRDNDGYWGFALRGAAPDNTVAAKEASP
jgi:hypothetical protein